MRRIHQHNEQFSHTSGEYQGNSKKFDRQEKEFEKLSDFPFDEVVCGVETLSSCLLTSDHKARIFQKFVYYFHEQANMISCMCKDECHRLKNSSLELTHPYVEGYIGYIYI